MVRNGVDKAQKVDDLAAPLGVDPVLLGWWSTFHGICAKEILTYSYVQVV